MSVRIHVISKQTGVPSKELIAILKERGYQVSTASSSIDPISAEALVEELAPAEKPLGEEPPAVETKPEEPALKPPTPPTPPAPPPLSAFVRSKEEIEREKEKRLRPVVIPPPPPPVTRLGMLPSRPGPRSARPPSIPPGARISPPMRRSQIPTARGPGAPPAVPRMAPPLPGGPPPVPKAKDDEEETSQSKVEKEVQVITLKPPIVVKEVALSIGLNPFRLISELMELGIFSSMNQVIEEEIAAKLAERHGFLLEVKHRGEDKPPPPKKKVEKIDKAKLQEPRPPVVCILGHVDHGKTTLLDYIRKSNVVGGEFGGITQHIGAYQIAHDEKKMTFLDTPGHAAFSKMRERGAFITDIAILVVAADDGFMPQSDEALKFAEDSGDPIIVAINKIDTQGANVDRVKTQMQERQIAPEDWGGKTICVEISALTGENVEEVLEMINLQAEIMELKAYPKGPASGAIIESQMEVGRGTTATVIVQQGLLKLGDAILCGPHFAKVRTMLDENGNKLDQAPPSTPVRIDGWSGTPDSGATFEVVKNEKLAKRDAAEADVQRRRGQVEVKEEEAKPATLDTLFAAIEQTKKKVFKVVVKCDVHGSVEAVLGMLKGIESSKVDLEVISGEVGAISKNDVDLASTTNATIIGFNVKPGSGVPAMAKHAGVTIMRFKIIYEMIDQVREAMADLLEPELVENKMGTAEVRQIFPISRGMAAGCLVTSGHIKRDAWARLLRKGEVLAESRVSMLKRFKDDVTEVRTGYECGIQLDNFNAYTEGDTIECYEKEKKRASL